ncbi:Uncharacterised protein [uncultured Blautia sp.]|nr:Uncharacterised protein [uncultured Blautia sp.]
MQNPKEIEKLASDFEKCRDFKNETGGNQKLLLL